MKTKDLLPATKEAENVLRGELETAWLRGWIQLLMEVERTEAVEPSAYAKEAAADYAERVVGGSTGPARPEPLSTPSKDENAA